MALKLVYRAAPGSVRVLSLLTLVTGAGPVAVLWIGKVVIDETAKVLAAHSNAGLRGVAIGASSTLVWSAIAFVVLQVLLDVVFGLSELQTAALRDRLEHQSNSMMVEKISAFPDLALFECPDLLDTIYRAEAGAERLHQLANVTQNVLTGTFAFVPVFVLSVGIAWWVPLLILACAVPSIYIQMRYERLGWSLEQSQAEAHRRLGVYARTLTDPEFAKELRMYSLRPVYLARWKRLFEDAYGAVRRMRHRAAGRMFAWSCLSGLGAGLPYVFVITRALRGDYSLGDLALFTGLVFELRRSLLMLIGNFVSLDGVALGCRALFDLLDLESDLEQARETPEHAPGASVPQDSATVDQGRPLSFRDVSFRYPGCDDFVLRHVTFTVEPGQMVAIVGENGAGKTTIAKLLCRLYDPSEGQIIYGDEDLRAIGVERWRRAVAVVYQDYAHFPATLRENIAFGSVDDRENDQMVMAAAGGAGLAPLIHALPAGLETLLTREFPAGEEPSGGQWQRIALARAFMARGQRAMVVLDEPTAALDPQAEFEVLAAIRVLLRDRSAVVISHRLALARAADWILVMAKGQLVEQGHHRDLMAQRGIYFGMFARQAASYVDGISDVGV